MSWRKRIHIYSFIDPKHPRCRVIKGWRLERVEWNLTNNPYQVTCYDCLKIKNQRREFVTAELIESARHNLAQEKKQH